MWLTKLEFPQQWISLRCANYCIFPAAKCTSLAGEYRTPWKIMNGYGVVFLSVTYLGLVSSC